MRRYVLLFLALMAGCATTETKRTPAPIPPVAYPPVQPNKQSANREIPDVAVVLGPGGAKALAHVGVIKALQENRIPIRKVIGIEWGALVAAAFGLHGQYHDVEWKIYRLDQVDLSGKAGFLGLGHGDHTVKVMDNYLRDNFGSAEIANMKIPFACPARSFWTGATVLQQKGQVTDAIRRCLPFPPLFQVQGNWLAAATRARDVVEELRAQGFRLVIFVDVLGSGSPLPKEKLIEEPLDMILWQDIQRSMVEAGSAATEFIRVSTDGIYIDRFDQRKELVQVGEQEGQRAAQRLSAKYGF